MRQLILILLIITGLASCIPYEQEQLTEVKIDYRDPLVQQIHDFQDQLLSDSLYAYLEHENPTYRYIAALAFASIKDSLAIDKLALLLNDPADAVKAAAAYAIGQTGASKGEAYLISAFDDTDVIGTYSGSNKAILEAIGKCGSKKHLEALSTISTYSAQDTALLEGQAWGIYRYALRDTVSETGTARMVELLRNTNNPESVRFIAANYLFRAKNIQLESFTSELISLITAEKDPRIRMALAIALGKTKNVTAGETLNSLLNSEEDYRVKCNILSALGNFDYAMVKEAVQTALRDPNVHVANKAAQYFLQHGTPEDSDLYWSTAQNNLPVQTQLTLYAAANRYLPAYQVDYRDAINAELRIRYKESTDPYEQALTLKALAEFGWNYRYVHREGFFSESPVVRLATIESLRKVGSMDNFNTHFGTSRRRVTQEIVESLKENIKTGDPTLTASAVEELRNEKRDYKLYVDSLGFLETALSACALPKDLETYNEIKKTIDFFKGASKTELKEPSFNQPIQWEVLADYDYDPIAEIRTNKGIIRIKLLPQYAPGTVINFIRLAKGGFYNDKAFHRVVPNFVVQGGCPRGDGGGGPDHTIRSELPPFHYNKEGFVGMASAGIHTEGSQFFITHSPAPHLDGNYTIFAEVTTGMDVVHKIQVGDKIQALVIK